MKNQLKKTGEFLDELVEVSIEVYKGRVEWQADAFKQAVDEGWFKYILIGAGITGTALLAHGLSHEDNYTAGAGAGMLTMDALYSAIIYLNPIRRYQNWRNKKDTE